MVKNIEWMINICSDIKQSRNVSQDYDSHLYIIKIVQVGVYLTFIKIITNYIEYGHFCNYMGFLERFLKTFLLLSLSPRF